jgi:hypothetical protein
MKNAELTGPLFESRTFPSALTRLELPGNKLRGPFCFSLLPECLEFLDISYNQFSGEVGHFPPALTSLKIHSNQFTGPINLGRLPCDVTEAYFQDNQFSFVSISRDPLVARPPVDKALLLGASGADGLVNQSSERGTGGILVLEAEQLPIRLRALNISGNPLLHGKVLLTGDTKRLTGFWS